MFINFYAIRYGDAVEQSTSTFSRLIRTNDLGKLRPTRCMGCGDCNISVNEAGKRAHGMFNCISVMDGIKINEQNKSICIEPLYLQTEFEAI